MKKVFIDANVVLRFITKDPPEMAEAALNIFKKAEAGEINLILIPLTVAEIVWVLESFYEYSKEKIAETLSEFFLCDGFEVEELDAIIDALNFYKEKNLDFADAFLAAIAIKRGNPYIYSFDDHFKRIAEIRKLEQEGE